ncbi:hypothetical protein [Nostoc sp.]|uniref:hypothetical protein n=1 Tax=Nostoc sp. TaxID=1180 RepID=UPI002FFA04FE
MTSIIINRLGTIDQLRYQCVKELEKTSGDLESNKTYLKFKQEFNIDHDQDKMNRYLQCRTDCILSRRKLEDASIVSIAERLEKLNGELESGIKNLNQELANLRNTITILETVERVIGIVSRIVLLAK